MVTDLSKCDDIGKEINRIFNGIDLSIYGKTEVLGRVRETKIEQWLHAHPKTKSFVVLDDRFLDSPKLRNRFVKTNGYRYGIDEENVSRVIEILNNEL